MTRPKITKEIILEAALKVASNIEDCDADIIAENYRHPMDGYELARELDREEGWDLTMLDVEKLDAMSSIVSRLHAEAEKLWVKKNDIQPPLPIGTKIKEGVIDSVYQHSAARYCVKADGCTQDGRFLLIKFEDAVSV